jgi:hypothetical protein
MPNPARKRRRKHLCRFGVFSRGEKVYIGGMNNDERHQVVKDIVSAEIKSRLYLYSYIALIVLAFVDVLFPAISLIVDSTGSDRGASMAASYVALAFAIVALVMLAILSALYFVQPDEVSPKRIAAVGILRILLRFVGLACGIALLTSSYLGLGGGNAGWTYFVRGWGIAFSIIEGIMSLFELWKNAWIKENPEKYLSPAYPVGKVEPKPEAPAKRNPAKAEAPKASLAKEEPVVEVEEAHPEPKEIASKKKRK